MCGRYVLFGSPVDLVAAAGMPLAPAEPPAWQPRWNAAPSQSLPIVVRDGRHAPARLLAARWGLVPGWVEEPPKIRPINARVEAVFEKPYFRSLLCGHRCLVPADAWYEWRVVAGGKQPYAIQPRLPVPGFFFPGLWAESPHTGGANFAILTGPAVAAIAAIHDRMPLAIAPADAPRWLDADPPHPDFWRRWLADEAAALEYRSWPVSRAVNTPRNDEPRLLEPITLGDPD